MPLDPPVDAMHVLMLGGTTEASAIAAALADDARFTVTLSLAGRTSSPKAAPVPTRIGGFGGGQGLAEWIGARRVTHVIDATHPFAARISANAARACAETRTPLLAIRRPAWDAVEGDHWTEVETMAAAVAALGTAPKRAFLTIGRLELPAFAAAPQHAYTVRTIEPIGDALPVRGLTALSARGPFSKEAETRLMREAGIEVLVTKNAGGAATYAKIEAARDLGIPVVILRQPDKPDVATVTDAQAALEWLTRLARTSSPSRNATGVHAT